MTAAAHSAVPELEARPAPFAPGDAPFWDDPYIATQLLAHHLDPASDAASRAPATIDAAITALLDHGLVRAGTRVLDLGCGPGLYAQRLAGAGAAVTGVDLSATSIAYARAKAEEDGLDIDYRVQNFLALTDEAAFDLALQAYGELNTFSDENRDELLARVHAALVPGGALVFDVTTPAAHRPAAPRRVDRSVGGLWRPGPHTVVSDEFAYAEDLTCHQYVVTDQSGCSTYRMWFHDYTPATLTPVLERAGFHVEAVWGSLSAEPYGDASAWFAVVARRR